MSVFGGESRHDQVMKLTYLLGPESVLAALTAVIFWIAARHTSGQGRDVQVLERLLLWLPLLVVVLAFSTISVPGAKTWWWLGRMLFFAFAALFVCSWRLIENLGGGAAFGFFLVLGLGVMAASLAAAVSSTMILCELRPSFAEWFQARRVMGSALTLLSAIPIGAAMGVVVTTCLGVVGGIWSAIR